VAKGVIAHESVNKIKNLPFGSLSPIHENNNKHSEPPFHFSSMELPHHFNLIILHFKPLKPMRWFKTSTFTLLPSIFKIHLRTLKPQFRVSTQLICMLDSGVLGAVFDE
jgi:hypothetical protein